MATIKDVAALAGVSPTTVSVVINGKAAERAITEETCRRIREAMEQLGYRPNLNARRLRRSGSEKPTVAFFWPEDYQLYVLTIALNDLLKHFRAISFPCEILIQTYDADDPEQTARRIAASEHSAVIVGCAGEALLEKLDGLQTLCPIVFMNRVSQTHAYVCADMKKMMRMTAQLIAQKGHAELGVFTPPLQNLAAERRLGLFAEACRDCGITVPERFILRADSTPEGGFRAMETYLHLPDRPRVVFSNSDIIAIGALSACSRAGVKLPEELEMLAIELMDPQFSEYADPPLTTISMPTYEMCGHIASYIAHRLTDVHWQKVQIRCQAQLTFRSSFAL